MNTEFTLKLKAFTLALMINGLILAGTAVLFDGQLHQTHATLVRQTTGAGAVHAALQVFRP